MWCMRHDDEGTCFFSFFFRISHSIMMMRRRRLDGDYSRGQDWKSANLKSLYCFAFTSERERERSLENFAIKSPPPFHFLLLRRMSENENISLMAILFTPYARSKFFLYIYCKTCNLFFFHVIFPSTLMRQTFSFSF